MRDDRIKLILACVTAIAAAAAACVHCNWEVVDSILIIRLPCPLIISPLLLSHSSFMYVRSLRKDTRACCFWASFASPILCTLNRQDSNRCTWPPWSCVIGSHPFYEEYSIEIDLESQDQQIHRVRASLSIYSLIILISEAAQPAESSPQDQSSCSP